MGTTRIPRHQKPPKVALTGDWPVIGGVVFSPDARFSADLWKALPSHQMARIRRFLHDRGRKAQYVKLRETEAGYEGEMVNVALEVDGPPEAEVISGDLSILLDDVRIRHGDMVWCHIGGASSSAEARRMFKEWLEDVINFGCDLL